MTQTVFKLSDAFIESYKTRKPNFGFNGLGELIYYRTYSRLKENNQNEQWWETCKRVVEGTYNMQKQHIEQYSLGWNAFKAQRSAQEMYERIFSMKFLPPGRGLWAMGSPIINERGLYAALNNCGYVSTATLKEDLSKPFLFLMDMSMLGVGIGFDVRGAGQINIKSPNKSKVVETYMIPDSREGWVESVKLLLESYFLGTADVNFDYSLIRPAGVPIKGFGGIASGVEPLKELHKNIIKTLDKNIGEPITVTTIVDIMNFIGKCVVAGNVRRCLRKGTLVFTPNGAKPIENILVGDTVFTSDGTTKVTESVYQGKQELLRINTDAGFIDCTEKHRIAVLDTPQSYMWKHANEITVDDRLVFIRPIVQDKHMEIPAFEYNKPQLGDERLVPIKVLSIEHVGIDDTYDLSVLDKQEFVLGNGLLVHNTAEIVFGEPDSDEYLDLKNYKVNPDRVEHGWSSNNSIFAEIGMDYGPVCDRVAHNGEPGFAWLSNMQNYSRMNNGPDYKDVRASGGNPCIIGDTLIAVADGRNAVPIKDLVGTQYPVYTIKNGKVSISMAIKTWKTRDNAKVYKLTLDDGSFLIATNDHKIMLRNGNYKELDTLLVGESLMPFNSYVSNKNYRQISSNTGRDRRQYRMIAEFNNLIVNPKITAIHHRNFNSFDDRIENLESMLHESHRKLHSLKMIGLNNPMKNPDIAIKAVRNRNYSGMNNPTCSNTKRKLEKKGLWNHKVLSVEFYGYTDVYDIEVENTHNFGIITVSHDNKYIRTSGIFIHNCLEQTLESYEMCCVSAETKIQTKYGIFNIKDLVGKDVQIWNGQEWSFVKPFIAAQNKDLYRVTLSDGSYLDCTDDHKWSLKPLGKRIFRQVETKDILLGSKSEYFSIKQAEGSYVERAYEWGLFAGDGYIDGDKPMLIVCGEKAKLKELDIKGNWYKPQIKDGYSAPVNRLSFKGILELEKAIELNDKSKGLPQWIFEMDQESIKNFIAGFIETDGNVCKQKNTDNYRIFGCESKIRDLQILLRRIGINHASIYEVGEKGQKTNFGIRNYSLWCCLIPSFECAEIPTKIKIAKRIGERYKINNAHNNSKIDISRKQKIVKVEKLQGKHTTYCFTEPEKHMGVFNNVLTYQCLVETFPMNHESLEDYRRTLKFAYLYAKTVTLGKTHWPETNRVLLRNRRIGCSVSGIAQFITKHGVEELRTWLEAGYIAIQNYDKIYSDWLAIPRSIKTTSVKPSGTVSLLAGATPGVHYPESRFYIRRVRLALTSQLVKPLEKAGYRVEPAFGDPSSVVVEIPIDTGEGIRTLKNVSMWEQLALAAFMQRYWADNQVSCTVTFANEEAQQIKFALDYYQYQLKGISFLPRIKSGAYPQMPYEEITETEYNESKSKLKMLDFSIIFNETTEVEKFCNNDTCTI